MPPQRIIDFLREHDLFADILINAAGIGIGGHFIEGDSARIDQLNDLNVTTLARLNRAFLPDMLVRGRGGIVNVSSVAGFTPGPYQSAYYASKAYVISFTRALALGNAGAWRARCRARAGARQHCISRASRPAIGILPRPAAGPFRRPGCPKRQTRLRPRLLPDHPGPDQQGHDIGSALFADHADHADRRPAAQTENVSQPCSKER